MTKTILPAPSFHSPEVSSPVLALKLAPSVHDVFPPACKSALKSVPVSELDLQIVSSLPPQIQPFDIVQPLIPELDPIASLKAPANEKISLATEALPEISALDVSQELAPELQLIPSAASALNETSFTDELVRQGNDVVQAAVSIPDVALYADPLVKVSLPAAPTSLPWNEIINSKYTNDTNSNMNPILPIDHLSNCREFAIINQPSECHDSSLYDQSVER